jgi:uncharacterized membrane-anchored protein YhcB (DUF1043 family)
MAQKQQTAFSALGWTAGYAGGYFLSTTILFFVLRFAQRLPESWSYGHVMALTAGIIISGLLVMRFLEMQLSFDGFKHGFEDFGHTIGNLVNSILLSITYIVGVGPTSLIAKIVRRSFLDTRPDAEMESYWTEIDSGKKPIEEHYRQF